MLLQKSRPVLLFPVLLACWLAASSAFAAEILKVASHELAPYHATGDDGEFRGFMLDRFACVMKRLGAAYRIQVYPWARAQLMLRQGTEDIAYAASRNAERDHYAEFSQPLHTIRWTIYSRSGNPYSDKSPGHRDVQIGVLLGSNMESWLRQQGFSQVHTDSYQKNFALLAMGRLDAVLATTDIYEAEARQADWQVEFAEYEVRRLEMGAYFSKRFLEDHPEFLERFNRETRHCIR